MSVYILVVDDEPDVEELFRQQFRRDIRSGRFTMEFAPSAADSDWETIVAGQRVQVIRPAPGKGGVLEFGTTVLSAADGSMAGLLGASPGASTAVPAMLDVMERCFTDRYQTWLPKLKEMVPSLGTELSHERALFEEVWAWGTKVLNMGTAENPRAPGG